MVIWFALGGIVALLLGGCAVIDRRARARGHSLRGVSDVWSSIHDVNADARVASDSHGLVIPKTPRDARPGR